MAVVLGAIFLPGLTRPRDSTGDSGGGGAIPENSGLADVVYILEGTADSADITYTDGSGNIQQQTGIAVPLVRKSDGIPGMQIIVQSGEFLYFSAQNMGESGDLDCEIRANGRVINRGHSSGGYAIVSCSAQVP